MVYEKRPTGPTRRDVLAQLGAGGSFLLALNLVPARARGDSSAAGNTGSGTDATPESKLFVAIKEDGTVEITVHRSEMGQHVWTSMAQIVADELEADWTRIKVVQAEGHPRYGDQNTDGSRSVRRNFDRLRLAGAAARAQLERAAATRWKVAVGECKGVNHEVKHAGSGKTLGYGELAAEAAALALPKESGIVFKAPSQWRYISKDMKSLSVPLITAGAGEFGMDVRRPGMLYAVIAHPPQVLGTVKSVDDTKTRATPGVLQTVRLPAPKAPVGFQPLGGVAVVAKDTWSAIRGRDALNVTWEAGPNAGYDSETYEKKLFESARKPGTSMRKRGNAADALGSAAKRLEAEYYAPHLAQAPMEPPAATAQWSGDSVEIWACVQTPQATRSTVAAVCGVPPDNVKVNVTMLGGGFGRKSKPDFAAEAALIAREVGKPVQVVWTREDDLQHGYFHAVSAQRLEAGLDDQGKCVAWSHRSAFPTISALFASGAKEPSTGEARLGLTDTPFDIPNLRMEVGEADVHVRVGWLRSVCNVYHAFAVQSFVAELAQAVGKDPKDYLLEIIGPPRTVDPTKDGATYDNYGESLKTYPIETGRLRHVIERAAEMAKWGRKLPAGHGLGIAAHRSFLSYVATVVEVAVDNTGRMTIPGVWSAMDAGTVVNPLNARSQLEGGTLYGLSNAMFGEMTAKNGAMVQANFPSWRVMRIHEAPRTFETHIVESNAPPGGVGEPPTPPAAPALANAIAAATGNRVRRLPIFRPLGNDRLVKEA